MAYVEREPATARDHVCGPRFSVDPAVRRQQSLRAASERFDAPNPFGCSGDRIATAAHRRRARVTCSAYKRHVRGGSPADPIDNRHRAIGRLEQRALLDMEFQGTRVDSRPPAHRPYATGQV
jgi:hypothetical protein